jgi:preprotein translocase subunit SecG
MMTFISVIHVIVALVIVALVLVQDSKSDGALGMGGGSSNANSILGATGAQTLAAKMTVVMAIIFAITCMTLTLLSSHTGKSVVDSLPLPTAPATAPVNGAAAAPTTTANPAAPEATASPAAAAPAPAASPEAPASK